MIHINIKRAPDHSNFTPHSWRIVPHRSTFEAIRVLQNLLNGSLKAKGYLLVPD